MRRLRRRRREPKALASASRSAGADREVKHFPDDRYVALAWTIPDEFGGITNVLLHRTATVAARTGRTIDLLTLAPDLDLDRAVNRLRESGRLKPGVRLRNVWHEFSALDDGALRRLAQTTNAVAAVADDPVAHHGESVATRTDGDGTVLQTDRYRRDGTRVVSDRLDVPGKGGRRTRRITVYATDGEPLGSWTSARALYFSWFDVVLGEGPAYLVNDSQAIGAFLGQYRRPNVVTVQVIHHAHLAIDAPSASGPLAARQQRTVEGLDGIDLVAILTDRQRLDLAELGVAVHNGRTIPNSRTIALKDPLPRPRSRGVMVARLVWQKRVDHAIRAMATVVRKDPEVTLDVFGSGKKAGKLGALVDDLGLGEHVELRGYDPRAAQHFETSSFSVLSSRHEGFPLVLMESMGAGCLPIAYDIRYGPSDIIEHGVNGFLVPPGDVRELARTIRTVAGLPEKRLAEMRGAAVARAQDFRDDAVLDRWVEELAAARARKRSIRRVSIQGRLDAVEPSEGGARLRGTLTGELASQGPQLFVAWRGRSEALYGRAVCRLSSPAADRTRSFDVVLPWTAFDGLPSDVLDLYAEVVDDGNPGRARLSADPEAFTHEQVHVTAYGNVSLRHTASASVA
ncbi:hypothetical protein GCM10023221_09160 [Luteimicrobium xylanilyticum]